MIPLMLVRVVVLAASVALLVGVWLWCAADEAAQHAHRVRTVPRHRPDTHPSARERGGGRHRLPETAEVQQRSVVPAWPSHDPDAKDPGRWIRPGTDREPADRHALAA